MASTYDTPESLPPDKRPRGGYSAPPPEESPRKDATADPSKEYVASSGYGAGLRDYLRALPVYVDDLTREVDLHVYERMRWDECVAGSLDALVYQALADDIDFRPAVDDEDSQYYDDSKAQADTLNRVMADMDRPLIEWAYEMVSDAIGGGNRVSEKVVRQEEGGPYSGLWVWDRLKVKPRRHLSFAMDTFNNLRGILTAIPGTYMGLDGSIPVDPKETPNLLPREKFAVLSWNSHNDDPRGRPLLRRVYVPWWEKIQVASEWLKHLARFGSPSVVGTTAPNSDFVPPQDEFGNPLAGTAPGPEQALLNGLERLQNGGCLVLPYGATVTALQVAQSGSAFLTKVDQCDRAISRGILLAIRAVMEAQHGSKADSQTAQDVTGLVVRYVKNWTARMITRDLVRPLVVWNKGADAARAICPYASLTPVEHQDWSQKATAVAALKTSGFLKPSQEPALAEEMGLPPATEPVEQPQPPQGQQPGQNGAEVNPATGESAATFAADPVVDLSDLDLSNLDRGEVLSLFVDAALHAQGEDGQSALFYDPNQLRDDSGRWTSGGGSGGMVHADRQVQRQTAQEHVRAFMRRTGPVQQKEAEELAVQLASLTIEQMHGLKKEHGLKASAPSKAALVAKLAERFQQARSGPQGGPVKASDPYAITKEKDKWFGYFYHVGERSFAKKEDAQAYVTDLKQRAEKEASQVKAAKEASDRAAEQKAAQEKRWRDYHAHWSEKAKELKGVKREIAVTTGTGKQAGIPATVYGGLAVHKRLDGPGIAITHERTGLRIGTVRTLADAKVMTAALLGAGIDWSFWKETDAAPADMKRASRIIRGFYAKIPPDDLAQFGDGTLSGDKGLSPEAATFAEPDSFDFGDISLGGLSREEIAEILIDAALDARDDASFGFDPNEARDEQGRWTTGGVGGVIADWHAHESRLSQEGATEEELQPLRQTLEKAQAAVEKKHTVYSELAGKLKEAEADVKQLEAAEPAEPQAKDYPPEPEEPALPEEPTPAQEQAYDRWDRDYAKWVDASAKVHEEHGRALDRWERTIDRVRSRRDSLEERTDAAHEKLEDTIYAWQEKIDEKVAEAEGTLADRQAQNAEFAAWEEAKHPRGQPENKGEFGPGGGGGTKPDALPQTGGKAERRTRQEQYLARIDEVKKKINPRDAAAVQKLVRDLEKKTALDNNPGVDENALLAAMWRAGIAVGGTGLKQYQLLDRMVFTGLLSKGVSGGALGTPKAITYHLPMRQENRLIDGAHFAPAEFYDPNQIRDHRGRWTAGGGSGGSQGLPHAERQAQRESARETVRAFMAGKGTPSLQESSGLAQALSTLTVAQIHEVKREHGLKASAPDKAGLVKKLAERFRAARESKPAEPKPSESKATGNKASDLRREAVKSAIGETYSKYNGTHQLLQDIAGKHDTLAGALAEAERQGLIDTRQRSPQADVSPLQRDRQGEFVRRVLGQAYGEKEAPKAQPKPKPVRDRVPEGTYGPSKAQIHYERGDDSKAVEAAARKCFGKFGTPADFASLAGAPDDASVTLYAAADGATITYSGDRDGTYYEAYRTLLRNPDGSLHLVNDAIEGKGAGLEIFGRQVEQATRLGVSSIRANAAGSFVPGPDPNKTYATYNGYITWPKLGYDGPLSQREIEQLPPSLQADVETAGGNLSGLMASKEGQDWWLHNGSSIDLTFDLAPGSYSQRTLAAYLEKRGILK